jgi:hypothetical protein
MAEEATTSLPAERLSGYTRLAILLAMAMFVLVVDTSLMNVSISAVVHDSLRTYRRRSSASGCQTARTPGGADRSPARRRDRAAERVPDDALPDPEPSGSVEGMSFG